MQIREEVEPPPPAGLWPQDRDNWIRHFSTRSNKEYQYFGPQSMPRWALPVSGPTLNTPEAAEHIRALAPDLVLVFGCGMIREPLLSALPANTINMHLGLSPRYRGAATLFWPFYFLEPNWAGVTFHHIVHSPDAGDIIHQTRPELSRGDGIHDTACKAVIAAVKDLTRLIEYGAWKLHKQKPEAGKNFLASDFKPQHLRLIYNVYNNSIVDEYLAGNLLCKEPILKTQKLPLDEK